jgi:surfeit locus 1 family protein
MSDSILTRMREKRLIIPAVMVALALPVMVGLGLWQLDRKTWKDGLIASI